MTGLGRNAWWLLGLSWWWRVVEQTGVELWPLARSRVHLGVGVCERAAQGGGRVGHSGGGVSRSIQHRRFFFFSSVFLIMVNFKYVHYPASTIINILPSFLLDLDPPLTPYLIALLNIFSIECRRRQWHPTPVLLPGKSHGWRSPVGCSPWGLEESDTTERLHFHFSLSCIGEGNSNPLQCSCLENPRDRGAWWAAIYGVTQSRTQLKRLSSSSSSSIECIYIVMRKS